MNAHFILKLIDDKDSCLVPDEPAIRSKFSKGKRVNPRNLRISARQRIRQEGAVEATALDSGAGEDDDDSRLDAALMRQDRAEIGDEHVLRLDAEGHLHAERIDNERHDFDFEYWH